MPPSSGLIRTCPLPSTRGVIMMMMLRDGGGRRSRRRAGRGVCFTTPHHRQLHHWAAAGGKRSRPACCTCGCQHDHHHPAPIRPSSSSSRHHSTNAHLYQGGNADNNPSSAMGGGGGGAGETFVSKYYQIEVGDILEFLQRKDFAYRETATHILIKECPFCPKPTLDKPDNEYKMYIKKDGGAFYCHRCGTGGSWFDFKRRLGNHLFPPMSEPDQDAWSFFPSSSSSSPASPSFLGGNSSASQFNRKVLTTNGRSPPSIRGVNGTMGQLQQRQQQQQQQRKGGAGAGGAQVDLAQNLKEYQYHLMDDTTHRHVRNWLTGTEAGQRGLSPTVLRKYGVGCGEFSFLNDRNQYEPTECVVFPWMVEAPAKAPIFAAGAAAAKDTTGKASSKGSTAATSSTTTTTTWRPTRYKVRSMKNKAWQRLHPTGAGWGLFGLHTVPQDAKEVVVTEGEFDAMAVYQATGRAAVSLPNGCRSLPVEVLPLLERFERILLWMDSDTPGVEGAEKFAHKLGVRRTFIVRPLPEEADPPKDANDALLRGLDLEAMIRRAKRLPDNRIIRFADLRPMVFDELRNKDKYEGVQAKSFQCLMSLIKGFRKGEMTVLSGSTGAGKTTFLSQLSIDLAAAGMNTLWGSFEVQNVKLVEKMMRQYHSAPLPMGDPKGLDAVADRFSQLPLLFMKFHGSSNLDEVMDAMEYCAYVYDTNLVILDNLQFMMSMGSSSNNGSGNGNNSNAFQNYGKGGFDRFHQMDVAVERFRRFATEKNVHVIMVVHPRKESDHLRLGISSISGTAKASQDADNILIIQRYQGRHYLDLRKNRFDGDLGVIPLTFHKPTGTLKEVDDSRLVKVLDDENRGVSAGQYGQGPVVRERQFLQRNSS